MNKLCLRVAALTIAAGSLSACIQSDKPILTDAKPIFGDRVKFQLYQLKDGAAREPDSVSFRWDGSRYVRIAGLKDIASFTIHPFEGRDSILQTIGAKKNAPVEYAIARWLADGTYLVFALDENQLEQDVWSRFCTPMPATSCHVERPEQVFNIARAIAAKPRDSGGLALRLADKP